MANLDDLLDRCLASRAEGRSLEECLADLDPELRQELRPLLLLAEAFRRAPRPALPAGAAAAQERALLMQATQLQTVPPRSQPRPRPWSLLAAFRSWRLALVPALTLFFLAASLVLMGGAGAMVSSARPDDALYSFKLSWEQAQLLVATNDAQRARVYLQIAQNRLDEIERLGQDGQSIPAEQLLQVKVAANQVIALTAALPSHEAIPILRELSALLTYENILLTRFLATLPPPERANVELAIQDTETSRIAVTRTLQERIEQQVPSPPPTSSPAAAPSPGELAPASNEASPTGGRVPPADGQPPRDQPSPSPSPPSAGDPAQGQTTPAQEGTANQRPPNGPQPVIRLRMPSPTGLPPQPTPPDPRGPADERRAHPPDQGEVPDAPPPPGRDGDKANPKNNEGAEQAPQGAGISNPEDGAPPAGTHDDAATVSGIGRAPAARREQQPAATETAGGQPDEHRGQAEMNLAVHVGAGGGGGGALRASTSLHESDGSNRSERDQGSRGPKSERGSEKRD